MYCVNFYRTFFLQRYNSTVLKKFEAAYMKFIKMFFGYDRTLSMILHNAAFKFRERVSDHVNFVAHYVHNVCSAC